MHAQSLMTRLFPARLDHDYRGHPAALWLLGLLVAVKSIMSLNAIANGATVLTGADGIPLDTYPLAAVQTVIALFAIWGLGHLMLALLGVIALARYRAMVPLVLVLLLLEHVARRGILLALPIARADARPGLGINLVLLAVTAVALALALRPRRDQVADRHVGTSDRG